MTNKVDKVILAFGINNRTQKVKQMAIKQLQRIYKAAKYWFPYAEIWIPLMNSSRSLPLQQQEALERLNAHIQAHMGFIPLLPSQDFKVDRDMIHWTPETAKVCSKIGPLTQTAQPR